MLGTHDLTTFLLASFLLWITPGPDTMYILARSMTWLERLSGCGYIGLGLNPLRSRPQPP